MQTSLFMRISNMKKFILKIVVLFAIIVVIDIAFGRVMNYVVNHIEVGGQGRDNYICNQSEDDILIFGSSRAVHHYNAQMIEDSLEMSCYNCGEDGNGIILNYGRLMMIKERKTPRIIICDINPPFDLFKNDNHKYLGWLKARYDRNGISDIFYSIDRTEKYKMMSQMYRYNSKFLQNIFVYFTSVSYDGGIKGYRPVNEEFDPMKVVENNDQNVDYTFDPIKISYIEQFIDLTKEAKVYFVVSPVWYGMDTNTLKPIKDICEKRNIPLIDYSNSSKYVHNNLYFKDGMHLNAIGADEFSRDIINSIK